MAREQVNLQFKRGRYYARLGVPVKLREAIGKRELIIALGADKAQALAQFRSAMGQMQAEIDAARRKIVAPKPLRIAVSPKRQLSPVEIGQQHLRDRLTFDDEIRSSGSHLVGVGFHDEAYIAELRQIAAGRRVDPLPEAIRLALDWARRNGPLKDEGATLRLLARAELVAIDTEMHRDEGEPDPPVPADLIPPKPEAAPATSARILCADSTKTLGELLPRMLAERKPTPSTQREYEVAVRQFEELIDPAPTIHEITRRTVQRFKDGLIEAPSSATKRFPGMTLPEATAANKKRAEPYPCLDPKTINDKTLMRLSGLLNWAVRQDIIPDNPATGVKAESTGGKVKKPGRIDFAPSDLTKIFAPESFAPRGTFGETQWAMLIGLFAGLRPSESAQIQLDSIRRERGVLCFIVEEETKTEGSRRIVPVHSTLQRLGFEAYVAGLRNSGATRLFPEWYSDGIRAKVEAEAKGKTVLNHYFPRFIPRRFNVTYRKNVGITDERKDFYSFRHTFKTGLAKAGVDKGLRDELSGHRDESAGAVYVHGVSIEAMRDAVELLSFDGFDPAKLKI